MTLESIKDGFFACDADWRFVYVNATAERILGICHEEMLGKSHWEVFPLTLGTNLESEYRSAAVEEIRDFENFYEPWGRWFHNRCYPHEGGGMSVYFEDTTERKRNEQQLFNTTQRLESILKALPVGISFSSDSTCQIITGNPASLAQFEGSTEDNISASALDNVAFQSTSTFLLG
jgi:PAS domain S-box-containing protein